MPEGISAVYVEPGHRLGETMQFVVRCRRVPADAEPRITSDEITAWRFVDPADLPRPMSDFTVRRITDALTDGPPTVARIDERQWLE